MSMTLTRPAAVRAQLPSISMRSLATRLATRLLHAVKVVLPLLVMLAVLLTIWQIAADRPHSTLPAPTKIWTDSSELILHPFFNHGGLDRGLGWHLFASLQRVAGGFLLASVAGIALGMLVGTSALAMRGLDPIFQVLRTVPPLAWLPLSLAAFREAQPSAIFVIFITAIWPVIINTATGVGSDTQD
jgi:nitrate/nitrite transport system permease protein